jgi:hypothetical protein
MYLREVLLANGIRINVTADPAVLLNAEPLTLEEIVRAEAIDPDARLVGFSVREPGPAAPDMEAEHYRSLLANAADFMIDRLQAGLGGLQARARANNEFAVRLLSQSRAEAPEGESLPPAA